MPPVSPDRISVQLYSLRHELRADRGAVLGSLARIGFRSVEHFDPLDDPQGFRKTADELGLSVCSVHADVLGPKRDALFEAAAVLGTDTVIVAYQDPARFAYRDAVAALAHELNQAAAVAAEHGLRLGYHNHAFELSSLVDGRPALEVLAELLDERVLFEIDTYWVQVGGQHAPDLLRRLGDRVRYLHVKDGQVDPPAPMTALGRGVMPVPEILDAASDAEWLVVELDACATPMLEAVEESFRYLTEAHA